MRNGRIHGVFKIKYAWKKRIWASWAAGLVALAMVGGYPLSVFAAETTAVSAEVSEEQGTEEDLGNVEETEEKGKEEQAEDLPVITSFAELSGDEAELSFEDKPSLEKVTEKLPGELSVFLDGASEAAAIPVTWECEEDYENTEFDVYEFRPVWDTDAYPLASSFPDSADVPSVTVRVLQGAASTRLLDVDEAKETLGSLLREKEVYALLYLCDTYEVKKLPGKKTETAVNATTGQSVRITGVDQDSLYNIWYQVDMEIGGSTYKGYIEREYLAYSDEDLLRWEDQCIASQTYRTAAPARRSAPARASVPADIQQFPSSYQGGLLELKSLHPNWIFVKMDTGVDWATAVQEENKNSRSLISSKVSSSWKKSSFDKSWSYPTDGILAYYIDPRNFLTEKYIFQFEFLSYNATYHTESAVQGILNGTFMSGAIPGDAQGRSYAQAFSAIGKQLDVSPFHLASRVRQEQGEGTSPLISGTHPTYPGVYNYFNIGATGTGSTQVINNGLETAQKYQWTTRYASLEGGSNIISKNYIRKGQNTLYLQKFNVNKLSPSGLYQHQYMQNIAAPSSEAISVKNAYTAANSIDNPFVFCIPVYQNMPSAACAQPAELKEIRLDKSTLSLKADETAILAATIDGKAAGASTVSFSSSNGKVASVSADGTVTALSAGTAVISCTANGAATASCTVTVSKADPAYTVPALGAVTYAPGQTLANIPLPAGWTWDNPAIVPIVSNAGYPATFTPADTGKYNVIKQTIALTVNKGTPAYTVPSGLQTIAGNALSSIKLPAGFTWETPSETLKEGTASYRASYNPDEANYQTVTGISIPVTGTKKADAACTTHTYGEWNISLSATCTSAGSQTRFCHICGAKETATIPASGHDYSSAVTKEPTEAENGIRTYTCSRCGDSYTETIDKLPPSHKHSYTSAITAEASCTQAGTLTYTCSCGDSYTETIPAIGHNYTSAVTKQATEAEAGVRTYICSRCQHSYTEAIAKLPSSHKHSYSSSITRQASCTEKGLQTYSCSCGDSYTEEIPALGHDIADGKCRRCGYAQPAGNGGNAGAAGNNSGNANAASESGSGQGSTGASSQGNNGSGSGNAANAANSTQDSSSSSGSNNGSQGNSSSGPSNDSQGSSSSGASNGSQGNAPSSPNNGSQSSNSAPSSDGKNQSSNSEQSNRQTNNNNNNGTNNHTAGSTGSNSANSHSASLAANGSASDAGSNPTVTLDMKDTTVLYEEALASILGQDVDVILNMGNSVSWTIRGNNIVADEANGIDMGVTLYTENIPETLLEQVSSIQGVYTAITLTLAHNGDFDFLPMLTISTAPENGGRIATLYYYNPDSGQLEYVTETEIAENGDICFTFSHASDYVVIISETVLSDNRVITPTGNTGNGGTEPEAVSVESHSTDPSAESEPSMKPSVIVVIILIVLLILAAICTLFFLLRSRHDDGEENSDEEDIEDVDDIEGIEDVEDIDYMEDFENGKKHDEEDSLDDGIDDYHEFERENHPAPSASSSVHIKADNTERNETDNYDDDEFDGFE